MTRPTWTPERALLTALQDCFLGLPPRRARKPKLEHHDALKLQAPAVVPTPKVEQAVKVEHVTNIRFDPSHGVTPVVRVESALRPRRQEDVTNNAARQSRWRSKQDAAALRLQARERMKVLRARRKNEESGDLRLPQHLLGHVSIHTTAACAHVTPRRERGAVDRIPGGAGRATKTSSLERGAGVRARIALCIATNDPRLAS